MNLSEAYSLASLNAAGQQSYHQDRTKTGRQLATEIWAEARSRGNYGRLGNCKTVEQWQKTYLPSRIFHLVRMPLNAAALTCTPREPNLVLKKIHAREDHGIVVDYNQSQMGKALHGFVPQVVCIDGKHRYMAAALRGDSHIMAWVGETAIEMIPSLQAVGGGGGGPAPERTTPAAGSSLVSSGKIKVGVRGEGTHLDRLNVKKCYAEFQADCASGKFKVTRNMDGVSAPGFSGTTKKMKEDHPEIDNPFALSWYMKNKGYHSHIAPEKGK